MLSSERIYLRIELEGGEASLAELLSAMSMAGGVFQNFSNPADPDFYLTVDQTSAGVVCGDPMLITATEQIVCP